MNSEIESFERTVYRVEPAGLGWAVERSYCAPGHEGDADLLWSAVSRIYGDREEAEQVARDLRAGANEP